jgi:eukaryotic-like serine/threonine-protein kinase
MNCGNCGALLPPDAAHCPNCGANTSNYRSFSATPPNDPTVVSTPYSAGPQTPPTAYGDSQPYQATPPPPTPYDPYNPYNPPTPYPYTPYPAAPLAPVPAPPQRRGNRIGIIIGVAALVLLIAGGGIFTLLRPGSRNSPVTASPTVNVTATAHVNATATATAAVEDPYTHSGTLTLADPLSDNGKGHGWDVNSNCAFIDGAYHVRAPNPSFSDYCIARSTDFSNLVFEAQMKIIKGDQGGIDFRVTSTTYPNDQYYDFYIGQDGSYELDINISSNSIKSLAQGTSSAINQGLNQTNLVTVVAQGSLIKLYVNHQLITSVTDSTYTHGQIGFDADPFGNSGHPTEVAYSNVRVWTL